MDKLKRMCGEAVEEGVGVGYMLNLNFCPSFNSPAFSTPCNVTVRHFPVLHFQRPPSEHRPERLHRRINASILSLSGARVKPIRALDA